MIECLRFIFSDFWIWLGTAILVTGAAASFRPVDIKIKRGRKEKEDEE